MLPCFPEDPEDTPQKYRNSWHVPPTVENSEARPLLCEPTRPEMQTLRRKTQGCAKLLTCCGTPMFHQVLSYDVCSTYIYLSIYLFIYRSIDLSIYLSNYSYCRCKIHTHTRTYIYIYVYIYRYIHVYIQFNLEYLRYAFCINVKPHFVLSGVRLMMSCQHLRCSLRRTEGIRRGP